MAKIKRNLGLQATLKEVLHAQAQHVIQLHLVLGQHANADQTTQQGVALEQSLRVLVLQGEQFTSGFADFGQCQLDAPHFTLVAQSELANQFELLKYSFYGYCLNV